jgi:hypothetical protein
MARVILLEEHASVLPHWVARQQRDATLVCLDAHLDLQFIAPQRIGRLRACASAQEFAALESAHPLSPLRDACYGTEDFLYAAAQLGVLSRLVWVAPPHVLGGIEASLRALRQTEGVTPEDLASFRRMPGGWIEGQLLGVPLAVGEWQHLVAMRLQAPVLLDIDTSYFVEVPEKRVWAHPRTVLAALRQWLGDDFELTVARSVGTGGVPLRHRFLADLLATLWEGRKEDARHWQQLLDLEQTRLPEAARLARLRALVAQRPRCAASCYALALACDAPQERTDLLAQAAALDGHYGDDVLRRAGSVRARRQDIAFDDVLRLHREIVAMPATQDRQGSAWVALGLLYAAYGCLHEAVDCDEQSLRHGTGHPELALQIAGLLVAAGDPESAVPWLERAAIEDETRVAAWHQLSLCAEQRGAAAEALAWARRAHQAAPAWREVQQRVASLQAGKA